MNDYDKSLMEFYAKILSSAIRVTGDYRKAEYTAKLALSEFKKLFPKPEIEKK